MMIILLLLMMMLMVRIIQFVFRLLSETDGLTDID